MTCARLRCGRRTASGIDLCKTHAKREADALFSTFIRRRDGRCQVCGGYSRLQCAHLISRAYLATRWDPANAVALCDACHRRYTAQPVEWLVWCEQRLGETHWRLLRATALKRAPVDYGEVLSHLRRLAA